MCCTATSSEPGVETSPKMYKTCISLLKFIVYANFLVQQIGKFKNIHIIERWTGLVNVDNWKRSEPNRDLCPFWRSPPHRFI